MLDGDALNQRGFHWILDISGELSPVAGDLLTEEDGGELADIGGLSSAKMVDESRHDLWVFGQAPYLILGLATGVIVRHKELDQ